MKSIRSGAGQIYWDVPFVVAAIVCGGQSGRTSAPTNPQAVQPIGSR
jgi:hypothetical protein